MIEVTPEITAVAQESAVAVERLGDKSYSLVAKRSRATR